MVRSVLVAALSFLLILGLYLFIDGACSRASEELMQGCREAEEKIRAGKKEEARTMLLSLEADWKQKADSFSFFVDHQRTERIEENLRTLCIALEYEEEFEIYNSLSLLKEAAESLYEAEAFVLKNIW